MLLHRRRITLMKLLASIAIAALPMALYAPYLRGGSGRRGNAAVLLVALIAHCVELEALVWLVLMPSVRSCLARWRGTRATQVRPTTERAAWHWDRVLLGIGPCLAVLMPTVGWGAGYRLPGFIGLDLMIILLVLSCNGLVLIPLVVCMAITSFPKRAEQSRRFAMTVALLVLAIPCANSMAMASDLGMRRLEHELGLARLAHDCVKELESRGKSGDQEHLESAEVSSPAIRRLRPSYIIVAPDRLRIELHGGFEHYGYELVNDGPNGRWVLEWYHVEGSGRLLMTWPIGSDP